MTLWLTPDDGANALLDADPLALLLGMLLDQQIPMEKAFRGPFDLKARIGSLDAADLAQRQDLEQVFAQPPAIHRFPGSMAKRVQALCAAVVEHYDGDVTRIWTPAKNGDDVLQRVKALPGFGDQKAAIFVALLGKQRGVTPRGWRAAAGRYGEKGVHRSVADVTGPESLQQVRAYKQEVKAQAKKA